MPITQTENTQFIATNIFIHNVDVKFEVLSAVTKKRTAIPLLRVTEYLLVA
jgi:hypothetical protein